MSLNSNSSNIVIIPCGNRRILSVLHVETEAGGKMLRKLLFIFTFFECYNVISSCTNMKIKMPVKTVKTDKAVSD